MAKGPGNYAIATRIKYDTPDRPGKPEKVLSPKGLIAVVGVHALPGTTQCTHTLRETIADAIDEAKRLYAAGIRNIMIQNVNDVPMAVNIGANIVTSMTAICYAVRNAIPADCVMGVSVLRDHGEILVSVAHATEMDYIRPKCYVGSVVGIDGIHHGIINDVLETRYKLKSNVAIIPDIHDRSTSPLGGVTLVDAVAQAKSAGLVDGINLAGKHFDDSLTMADEIKAAFPDLYINIGGGANPSNLETVYKHFDGIFVASCLKDTGNMTGKLDDEKLRIFMEAYNKVK